MFGSDAILLGNNEEDQRCPAVERVVELRRTGVVVEILVEEVRVHPCRVDRADQIGPRTVVKRAALGLEGDGVLLGVTNVELEEAPQGHEVHIDPNWTAPVVRADIVVEILSSETS